MGLLTLAAEQGEVLSIKITGDDANKLEIALRDLVGNFFGEGH